MSKKDKNQDIIAEQASEQLENLSVTPTAQNTSDIAVVGKDISSTGVSVGAVSEDLMSEPLSLETDEVIVSESDTGKARQADDLFADSSDVPAPEVDAVESEVSNNGEEALPHSDELLDIAAITSDAANEPYVEDENEQSIEEVTTRTLSPGRIVLKRFFRSKLSITGLVILIVLFLFSFVGPLFKDISSFIWGEDEPDNTHPVTYEYTAPIEISGDNTNDNAFYDSQKGGETQTAYIVTYSTPTNYLAPSKTHFLGTDDKGYDVFSRLMYGGRISLTIGFVVVILETVLGILLGGLAGYFGKWVDQVVMRIVDVFECVPTMPMLMIVGVALEGLNLYGIERLYIMMAFMTLLGWAGTARLVRGQILSLREQDFMLSAEASGLTVGRKIFKHLIPNVIPQLIVSMTLGLGGIILTEATLGYLGIGLPTQYATWGNMINSATNNMVLTNYPNLWISPGVLIVLAVLGFNFVGDGLRDAFDPKARR